MLELQHQTNCIHLRYTPNRSLAVSNTATVDPLTISAPIENSILLFYFSFVFILLGKLFRSKVLIGNITDTFLVLSNYFAVYTKLWIERVGFFCILSKCYVFCSICYHKLFIFILNILLSLLVLSVAPYSNYDSVCRFLRYQDDTITILKTP